MSDIKFEDFHQKYLIEDGALYLVDSASGYTAVYGEVFLNGIAGFRMANNHHNHQDNENFDDTPDRIAKLTVQGSKANE